MTLNKASRFFHDTQTHDDVLPHNVWLKKAEWFRRYLVDKTQTHRQKERWIVTPLYSPYPTLLWGHKMSISSHKQEKHTKVLSVAD